MAVTYGNLVQSIRRLLSDSESEVEIALIVDAINAALVAVLPWVPLRLTATLSGDGETLGFTIPTGLYDIEACVQDSDGAVLPKAQLSAGSYYGIGSAKAANDWLIWNNLILFSRAIPSGQTVTVYYYKTYTEVAASSANELVLGVPDSCSLALTYFAAAHVLTVEAIQASTFGQFKTRVDSGDPEHNPMQRTVEFLRTLFTLEMNRHPKVQRH